MTLTEAIVEAAALDWFQALGYAVLPGLQLAHGEPEAERDSFADVLLLGRLRQAIGRLNPTIPDDGREESLRKLLRLGTPSVTQTNRAFHQLLRDGVSVEYARPDGSIAGDHVRLVDFTTVAENDWLVVNQFSISDGQHSRRPDLVVFLNGSVPISVVVRSRCLDSQRANLLLAHSSGIAFDEPWYLVSNLDPTLDLAWTYGQRFCC